MKLNLKHVSLFLLFILLTLTLSLNQAYATTIPVGSGPMGVTLDSNLNEIFVTNSASNTVSVISDATNRVTATIIVGSHPENSLAGVAFDSNTNEVF